MFVPEAGPADETGEGGVRELSAVRHQFLMHLHQVAAAAGIQFEDLRAVWLGDGDPALRERLRAGGVEVTGWLPREATFARLGAADLYLHSARWEGFPLLQGYELTDTVVKEILEKH